MLDIIRDSAWQFVGVLLAAVALWQTWKYAQRSKSISKSSDMLSQTQKPPQDIPVLSKPLSSNTISISEKAKVRAGTIHSGNRNTSSSPSTINDVHIGGESEVEADDIHSGDTYQ